MRLNIWWQAAAANHILTCHQRSSRSSRRSKDLFGPQTVFLDWFYVVCGVLQKAFVLPHRFKRGRADESDPSLQVIRQWLHHLLQGSNITETTLGKTLTSFPTVGKFNCNCWQSNWHIGTIPRDIYTRMTAWRPSLGTHIKKKLWEFCFIFFF